MVKIILSSLLLLTMFLSNSGLAKKGEMYFLNNEDEAKADQLLKDKKYDEAKVLYLKLAGAGSKYAQYVVSTLYLNGYGGEQDFSKAYAWARVAKESENHEMVKHFNFVKSFIPKEDLSRIHEDSQIIYKNNNSLTLAEKYLKHFRDELPKCTGSRLKGGVLACSQIKVSCNMATLQQFQQGFTIPDFYSSFGDSCLEFAEKITPKNLNKMREDIVKMEKFIVAEKERRIKRGEIIIHDENH